MKRTNFSLVSGICSLLMGIMLVLWSQSIVKYLIMAVGFLFLIPGIYALFSYFFTRKGENEERHFGWTQIVGIGSILFGFSLILCPVYFETTLMYAIGVILAYAGLNEIITLASAREWTRVSGGFYVIPVLVMVLGIFILFNPISSANIPFILLGIGCIAYGISGIIDSFRFRKPRVEEVTEIVAELPQEEASTETNVTEEKKSPAEEK